MHLKTLAWLVVFVASATVLYSSAQHSSPSSNAGVLLQYSKNVSACPGYTLIAISPTKIGLVAQLALAGLTCNAFGTDYLNLTLEVTYETSSRLHLKIEDTAQVQFRIPESVIARPRPPIESFIDIADFVFNYHASPFQFWITRRDEPESVPIFDTRLQSLPMAPVASLIPDDPSTRLEGFPLVFEDKFLQLTSALPYDANIYGLGEAFASHGFRRDTGANGGRGSIQTSWTCDVGDVVDNNTYGAHPIYMEHRLVNGRARTHGVLLLSSAPADILLLTPPTSNISLIQYRMVGGIIDLYFVSGPGPLDVVEEYAAIVGLPTWQPYWGLGFHLCHWGDINLDATKEHVRRMREANVPLEVMWNDIDMFHDFRDFTTDPVRFPTGALRTFIQELRRNDQHYVHIVDPYIGKQVNSTDLYDLYQSGVERRVFVTNPNGTAHTGQSRPGYIVFPDWFANATQGWWTNGIRNWTSLGIDFSGLWLDKNEVSSPCNGVQSCQLGLDIVNRTMSSGLSASNLAYLNSVGLDDTRRTGSNLDEPPYAIHNTYGPLAVHTMSMNATHFHNYVELDVHNLFGLMEARATRTALHSLRPGIRSFLISRSTFPSAGKWTGHWLGDNASKWRDMRMSIQGVLEFQLFGIPMVGADACGFNGNTTEELCNRWMQLAAFHPFFRNHNVHDAVHQEPYQWESVAAATRNATSVRYTLLPYWYTLFANASRYGRPPVRALWFEFPDDETLFGLDTQFLVGRDILVTPVLEANVSTVQGVLPGAASGTIWRDWYTHELVPAGLATLHAPLGHIPVHVRGGAILLLHAAPGYTTAATRAGPYKLLVVLDADGRASGNVYIDDGESDPPGPSTTVTFSASSRAVNLVPRGGWTITSSLESITILGVYHRPQRVMLDGDHVPFGDWHHDEQLGRLLVRNLSKNLNFAMELSWN